MNTSPRSRGERSAPPGPPPFGETIRACSRTLHTEAGRVAIFRSTLTPEDDADDAGGDDDDDDDDDGGDNEDVIRADR